MGMPKLWAKDKEGNRGLVFGHVKTIYYNWASKILLKTKLDEMDRLIEEKVAKAMMSSQQVNDANRVPTSALAYEMGNNITKNAEDIAAINGSLQDVDNRLIRAATHIALDTPGNEEGAHHRLQLNNDGAAAIYHYDPSTDRWPGDFVALKSDLGDIGGFKILVRGVSDLDNPPNAFILQTTAGNVVGFPSGLNANSCVVYQYNPGDKSYSAQVAFAFGADKIGIRRRNAASGSTAWTGWKYLAFS